MDTPLFVVPTLADMSLFKTQAYIDGVWIDANNGRTFEVDNPSTGEVIARVANLGKLECELAINAASKAFTSWRARTGKDRAALLRRWFDLITANAKDLATLMTLEQGKPFQEALGRSEERRVRERGWKDG